MSLKVIVVFTGLVAMLASCTEAAGAYDRYSYPNNYNSQQQYACPVPPPCPTFQCPAAPEIKISNECKCDGNTQSIIVKHDSGCTEGCCDSDGDSDNKCENFGDFIQDALNGNTVPWSNGIETTAFVTKDVQAKTSVVLPNFPTERCHLLGCTCDHELVLTYLSVDESNSDPLSTLNDIQLKHKDGIVYLCEQANGDFIFRSAGEHLNAFDSNGNQIPVGPDLDLSVGLPNVVACDVGVGAGDIEATFFAMASCYPNNLGIINFLPTTIDDASFFPTFTETRDGICSLIDN